MVKEAETERPQRKVQGLLEGEFPEGVAKQKIHVPAMPAQYQA